MALSRHCVIISLGSLPETNQERAVPSSLLDLAPGGGCLAVRITANAGGLLHHLFNLTHPLPASPKSNGLGEGVPLGTEGVGSLFLWPDPIDYSIPGFPRRRALRSADFPRSRVCARPRSPNQPEAISSYTQGRRASTGVDFKNVLESKPSSRPKDTGKAETCGKISGEPHPRSMESL